MNGNNNKKRRNRQEEDNDMELLSSSWGRGFKFHHPVHFYPSG
jgi:hypothetical protein